MEQDKNDFFEGVSGTVKHALARIPVIGEMIAGYEAYKRSKFDREVIQFLAFLENKVENITTLFSHNWLKTEEGQQYVRKVIDSALDAQMEDKQELFVNALINGIENQNISQLEKLKFVDMLRHLSRASLMVLADMHNIYKDEVVRIEQITDGTFYGPIIDANGIARKLAEKYNPYLTLACLHEMESEGLFSFVREWSKSKPTSGVVPQGLSDMLSYNQFTYKFVEFITPKETQKGCDEF